MASSGASLHFLLHCQSSTRGTRPQGIVSLTSSFPLSLLLPLFVDFQRTFLKEMKNFMSYFLFNFFRFFLCTPLPTSHLRKWACAWPAAKLIMDERSASCRIVSPRVASQRGAINIIFNSRAAHFRAPLMKHANHRIRTKTERKVRWITVKGGAEGDCRPWLISCARSSA